MIKTDIWPEIPEARAEGDTARLYSEIRAVTGIPLVNLIYRHIATIHGGLSWTWSALRPLYESNILATSGMDLICNARLPAVPQIPEVYFTAAGLRSNDLDEITSILDFYVRGNAMNLLAMLALGSAVDQGARQSMALSRDIAAAPAPKPLAPPIRPILQMDALNESTRVLITNLNKLGEGTVPDSVSPSLFRHLAHWPVYLCLAGIHLLPLDRNGTITAGARTIRDEAGSEAGAIVSSLKQPKQDGLDARAVAEIRAVAGHFADVTIPRLLAICVLLRRALPRASSGAAGTAAPRT